MPEQPASASPRFLIVEAEALIALYIQAIVDAAFASESEIVPDFAAAAALAHRFGDFALAIVNHPEPRDAQIVGQLVAACRAIVVCTGAPEALAGTTLAGAVAIQKPFAEEDLIAACRLALGRR